MIIDDLKTVRAYVNDAGAGEYGFRDTKSIECIAMIDSAIKEIEVLKQTVFDNVGIRAGYEYLIRELEDKLATARGQLK